MCIKCCLRLAVLTRKIGNRCTFAHKCHDVVCGFHRQWITILSLCTENHGYKMLLAGPSCCYITWQKHQSIQVEVYFNNGLLEIRFCRNLMCRPLSGVSISQRYNTLFTQLSQEHGKYCESAYTDG